LFIQQTATGGFTSTDASYLAEVVEQDVADFGQPFSIFGANNCRIMRSRCENGHDRFLS